MTNNTQNIPNKFLQFNNLVVNYSDGDITILEHVNNISEFFPIKPKNNLFVICLAGRMTLRVGENEITVNKNDVMFCPPKVCIDQCEMSADFDCNVLSLSDDVIQGLLHDKIDVWHHAVYIEQVNVVSLSDLSVEEFGYYYNLIHSKIHNHEHIAYDIVQAIIRAVLLEICQILESQKMPEEDVKPTQGRLLFNRFLKSISTNEVKRQPITKYASELAITPKYLTMLCLKYSNKTASDWIVQYTLEDIRFYLRSSNLSIKEISAKLGFANLSHFGSYVRKHMGVSPSDFRHRR